MKKKLLVFVSFAVFFSIILYPYHGEAASRLDEINRTIQELEKQRHNIALEQQQTDQQIKQLTHDKNKAQQEVSYILNLLDQVAADLQEYQSQINTTTADLQEAGKQHDEAEKRVQERDQLIREKLRLMYTNGVVKYIDVLLNSSSFADFLDRFNSLTMIVNQDKSILEAQKKDRDLIAQKEAEIGKDLASLKDLYAKKEAKQQSLIEQERKKEVLIASIDSKQEDLAEISEEQEKNLLGLASQVAKLNAEKRTYELKNDGNYIYPLPKRVPITSGFGSRIDPITGKKGAFHNGIDLGASKGTDVLATANGEVLVAGWVNGFGNCIIIDHGGGIWSLYGHMLTGSLQVEKGDTVKKGEVIGHVGMTGRATGYHLHFTIYKNEVAVDPSKYVNFN